MNQQVNHPDHYNQGASDIGKDALIKLGIKPEHMDLECIVAIERHYPWLLREALLFNAVTYLWRVGVKPVDIRVDLGKTEWYLVRWLNEPLGLIGRLHRYMLSDRRFHVLSALVMVQLRLVNQDQD